MQATARSASVVLALLLARRRLIRSVLLEECNPVRLRLLAAFVAVERLHWREF